MKKNLVTALAVAIGILCLFSIPIGREVVAQGLRLMDGSSSNLVAVDSNGNVNVKFGRSDNNGTDCYIASIAAQATTAAIVLSLEAPASYKIAIERICVASSPATAGAAITTTIQRRTTASSAGTPLVAEGTTGTNVVSKLDPASGNFAGVARNGGTPGTAGAIVDQWNWTSGEVGTIDVLGQAYRCKLYGAATTEKALIIAAGTTNGLTVNVSSHGAGGLAAGNISMEFCTR